MSLVTSKERTPDDEPSYVDCVFDILLNDPAKTRISLPVRVTAEEALAPGEFDEMGPDRRRRFADYHWKAFYALCRFGRALSELANSCPISEDDGVHAFSVWAGKPPC